ncbi:MAG TPA: hypothetical protein VHE37_01580 [Nevskiaceae bacterium]|nr:hypothetical protein [Nevskiaceae bacterium]
MEAGKRSGGSRRKINGGVLGAAAEAVASPLVGNFKDFLGEAEALIRATAEFSSGTVAGARAQLQRKLDQAREMVNDVEEMAKQGYSKSVELSEKYVRENPWQIVAAAVALGFILGRMTGRGSPEESAG